MSVAWRIEIRKTPGRVDYFTASNRDDSNRQLAAALETPATQVRRTRLRNVIPPPINDFDLSEMGGVW